jgi:hypothetical protein
MKFDEASKATVKYLQSDEFKEEDADDTLDDIPRVNSK